MRLRDGLLLGDVHWCGVRGLGRLDTVEVVRISIGETDSLAFDLLCRGVEARLMAVTGV